jgi:hypothetical protein
MLGVTFFGIFLTPVFYFVVRWFSDRGRSKVEFSPAKVDVPLVGFSTPGP